jgi:SAM-dependent methyltransferase
MTNWTDGYVADVSYDYSFFSEITPINIAFNLLDSGFLPPNLENFTYCELGCGQGFTTNLLAATHPKAKFWSIDFNPAHIAEAQRLAETAKLSNIHFLDQSFAEFLKTDTPKFDFITLHGVYAWIGDENRQIIVDILHQKLKAGGAVYISYNALPGWAAVMPLRDLMVQYADNPKESTLEKVEKGLNFALHLQDLKARYFTENPILKYDLDNMQVNSRRYLAHEYFSENWRPLYHSEVAQQLADAKLMYATSADITDQFYNLKLDDQQLDLLSTIPNTSLRETVRDFLFNTRFRRDIFIKGSVHLSALEQVEALSNLRFALIVSPEDIEYEIELVGIPIQLDKTIYQPIISTLAQEPKSLRELMQEDSLAKRDFSSILQALKILISTYSVVPALSNEDLEARQESVKNFNTAILKRARFGTETQVLASPITGSGIDISRSEQLFLLAQMRQVDPVQFVWNILNIQGEKLIKDDEILETPEANQAELREQVKQFIQLRLPLLTHLGIL